MLKKKTNNKSQGHVEMIVSFTLFLGFLIALLFILSPAKNAQSPSAILDTSETKIMGNISADYKTISLILSSGTDPGACFVIQNKPNLTGNIIVKSLSDIALSASSDADWISITPSSGNRFHNLYFSSEFDVNLIVSCGNILLESNYSFGAIELGKIVLYKKLLSFITEYNEDYESLRNRMSLKNDFVIFVYDTNKNLLFNASRYVPAGSQVASKSINTRAIDLNKNITNIVINIRVW